MHWNCISSTIVKWNCMRGIGRFQTRDTVAIVAKENTSAPLFTAAPDSDCHVFLSFPWWISSRPLFFFRHLKRSVGLMSKIFVTGLSNSTPVCNNTTRRLVQSIYHGLQAFWKSPHWTFTPRSLARTGISPDLSTKVALAGSGCTTVRHMDTAICVQTFLTSLEGVAQPRAEFAHCEDGRGVSATLRRVQLSLVWMQNDFKLLEGKAFDCVFHVLHGSVFGTTFWKLGHVAWSLAQNPVGIPQSHVKRCRIWVTITLTLRLST